MSDHFKTRFSNPSVASSFRSSWGFWYNSVFWDRNYLYANPFEKSQKSKTDFKSLITGFWLAFFALYYFDLYSVVLLPVLHVVYSLLKYQEVFAYRNLLTPNPYPYMLLMFAGKSLWCLTMFLMIGDFGLWVMWALS